MKNQLIYAFSYPRFLIRDCLRLDDCEYDGVFNAKAPVCRACRQGPECQWLLGNGETVALANRSMKDLIAALDYATDFVVSQISFWDHDRSLCSCDSCRWLRTTQQHLERCCLERVEKQNRLLAFFLACAVPLLAYFVVSEKPPGEMVQSAPMAGNMPLQLFDQHGNNRLSVQTHSGRPVMKLTDGQGVARMTLGLSDADTPFISLSGTAGETRAVFRVDENDTPSLDMYGRDGNVDFSVN